MIYENRKSAKFFICLSVTIIFIVCLITSICMFSQASADETNDRDWITVMGKVVDADGERVESAQIQYINVFGSSSIYSAALDGGFLISIPSTSSCSLIYYQDGYAPKKIDYSAEFLQEHQPVLNVGNIVLGVGEYVKISGQVFDSFYMSGVNKANVNFIFTNLNEACCATTEDDGSFSLTVPKGYSGIWKVSKDGYNLYVSEQKTYVKDTVNVDFVIREINKHKVTFESNGGSLIDFQIVEAGASLNKPQDPILENYEFGGWYLDNNTFENPYDFSKPVNNDLTLYAKWTSAPEQINSTIPQTGDELFAIKYAPLILAIGSGLYIMQNIIKKDNE